MELAIFLTSLRIQDRPEFSKGIKIHWGETPQRNNVYWERVHRTYFLDGGNYWEGEITYTGRGAPNIICCGGGDYWGGYTT